MAKMIKCTDCLKKFNPFDAKVARMGKSKKICCPMCMKWMEYGRVTK
jgi:hypothetical protein